MRNAAFLFKRGRKERLASAERAPSEFFYGYVQLAKSGVPVVIFDEDDLQLAGPIPFAWRVLSTFSHALFGIHLWVIWRLSRTSVLDRLNQHDVLIATTNIQGLALAALKRIGRLNSKVVFLAMGVGDLMLRPSRRVMIDWLLRCVRTVAISKGEVSFLNLRLSPKAQVSYMPFGVDTRFWTPDCERSDKSAPYILSIGNDPRRDYATLLAAWKPEYPLLKIITGQSLASAPNVEVTSGDWRQQILSDSEVRRLFRDALFVVLPIEPTVQPSGQSACLQAMACAKAVIISDIEGIWDRDLMRNGETCVLVPPGTVAPLQAAVEDLLAHPDVRDNLGANARRIVEEQLNVDAMAEQLIRQIEDGKAS